MAATLDLTSLITRLLGKGNQAAQESMDTIKDGPTTTTIRLPAKIRQFYDIQAEALNTSLQSVLITTLTGVAEVSMHPVSVTAAQMGDRFLDIFQSHGITLPYIPEILPDFNITLSTLADKNRLLDCLSPVLIQKVSELFGVNAEWLSVSPDEARPTRTSGHWYDNVPGFCKRLASLVKSGQRVEVIYVKSERSDLEEAYRQSDDARATEVGVIVKVMRSPSLDSRLSFATYEWWGSQRWNYSRCRLQLKTIMLFCERNPLIHQEGRNLSDDAFRQLANQLVLVADVLKSKYIGDITLWYPLDYISKDYDQSKEKDEFSTVLQKYKEAGLVAITASVLGEE